MIVLIDICRYMGQKILKEREAFLEKKEEEAWLDITFEIYAKRIMNLELF